MKHQDIMRMCLQNLLRRKSRTLLTLLGVLIGCCSIVIMVSIGMGTAEAQKKMLAYSWPGNLTQFKRIIKELVISSETSYISLGALQKALWSEEDSDLSGYRLELTKTLDQITRDIALTVLKEEGGNKTKAAKRLGIARNTLWRILKE